MKKTKLDLLKLRLDRTIWKGLMHIGPLARFESSRIKAEYPKVMTIEETVDRLIGGASISRFGDGEFSIFLFRKIVYQRRSEGLAERYAEIFAHGSDEKFLIGITSLEFDIWERNRRHNFSEWFWLRHWRYLKHHFRQPEYANAFVSRIPVFEEVPLEKIKAIWDNRDVVFVVPPNGRFRFDERLFGNMKSVEYVDVPPKDAFDEYDKILAEALKHDKDKLYFIAAGPTATVLAFDLYKTGRQAIDMGHLANCFHEYLGETGRPESLPIVADHPNPHPAS